ncbi:MAG: hypothetical protein HHJ12_04190 [Glaciimonas sp.]|nr:hypothetical protein [Glaciimonas sp.]
MSVINCFDCLFFTCNDGAMPKKFGRNAVNLHIATIAAAYILRETAVNPQPGYWAQDKGANKGR